jgi:D-alanyl-lipoteichoic acid acyltransferase DltB (MBOAT superfamily)
LHFLGVKAAVSAVHVILPIGISFYTLQSISYLVDVYRGSLPARAQFFELLASLSFFPHLVSGPIDRPSLLLPQFERIRTPTWEQIQRAFVLIVVGALKKAIADGLAGQVDGLFGADDAVSAVQAWSGVLAYAGQLYADFSGYTDMAMGIALLLGFNLTPNFNLPYLATSPIEFWKRWHMSLSSWLHDYLYLPVWMAWRLPYLSLLITWLVAGLWHGPQWIYVFYGGYHGLLLVTTSLISRHAPSAWIERARSPFGRFVSILVTFHFVLLGFVMFRAPTLEVALKIFAGMYDSRVPSMWTAELLGFVLPSVALIFCHVIDYLVIYRMQTLRRPLVWWPATLVCLSLSLLLTGAGPHFIYQMF